MLSLVKHNTGQEKAFTCVVGMSSSILGRFACHKIGFCGLRHPRLTPEDMVIGNSSISHLKAVFTIRVLCDVHAKALESSLGGHWLDGILFGICYSPTWCSLEYKWDGTINSIHPAIMRQP